MILMFVISVIIFVVLLVMAITGFGYLLVFIGFIISKIIGHNRKEKIINMDFENNVNLNLIDKLNKMGTFKLEKHKNEINKLDSLLKENEELVYVCKGNITKFNDLFNDYCLLCLTTDRILIVTKKDSSYQNEIKLDRISTLEHKTCFGLDKLIVHLITFNSIIKITNIDKPQALSFKINYDEIISNKIMLDNKIKKDDNIKSNEQEENEIVNNIEILETVGDSPLTNPNNEVNIDNSVYKYIQFYSAGSSYYKQQIKLLLDDCEYEKYNGMSNKEIKEYGEDHIEWEIPIHACCSCEVELIPEPDNKFDKNAVMVLIDGYHIGYVPKKYTIEVIKILENITLISAEVLGGKYKEVVYDDDYKINTYSTNITFNICIQYKVK